MFYNISIRSPERVASMSSVVTTDGDRDALARLIGSQVITFVTDELLNSRNRSAINDVRITIQAARE